MTKSDDLGYFTINQCDTTIFKFKQLRLRLRQFMQGKRKLFLTIFTQLLLFIGILTNKISGDTGAWAIISCYSGAIVGYGSEYLLKNSKRGLISNIKPSGKTKILKEK